MNIDVSSNRLNLVPMTLEFMETSLSGDRESAQRMVGYRIPADWPRGVESTLRFRIAIARAQPETLPLLLRAMVLRSDPEVLVGRIGFHGPPDDAGMLEIGYEVFPSYRRRGYAREAVQAMLRWAQHDPAVRRFRASLSPDNLPPAAWSPHSGSRRSHPVGRGGRRGDGIGTHRCRTVGVDLDSNISTGYPLR
jgi:ribosomal-protein-alanine N-acetyltransferase